MNALVTEIVEGERYNFLPLGKYIVRAPSVCSGRPTFKYTRIEIAGSLERLASGERLDDMVLGFRNRVPREAMIKAIELVTRQYIASLPILEPAL